MLTNFLLSAVIVRSLRVRSETLVLLGMLKHSQAAPPLRTLDWVSPPQFEWLLEEFKGDLSLVAMEMRSERQGPFEYWDLRRLWYALIEGASGSHSHPNIGQAPPKMHGLPLLASTAPCRLSFALCLLSSAPVPDSFLTSLYSSLSPLFLRVVLCVQPV